MRASSASCSRETSVFRWFDVRGCGVTSRAQCLGVWASGRGVRWLKMSSLFRTCLMA